MASLDAALTHGFAIETDVRDQYGEMVISHDPCDHMRRDAFDKGLAGRGRIAVNIKSDGLLPHIVQLREYLVEYHSFIFDCSFPQILQFKNLSIPHALRISEYEKELPWKPDFIWLDAFESDWWVGDSCVRKMMDSIPTVIVSPELHGRDNHKVWEIYSKLTNEIEEISICTDFPLLLALNLGDL